MSELLLCAACLNNEVNLIPIDTGQLRDLFNVICSVQTQCVPGIPQYLCVMCVAYLRKMMKLREQCLKSSQHFQEMFYMCKEENREYVNEDFKPFKKISMLSFPKFDKFMYTEIDEKDSENKDSKVIHLSSEKIPILHYDIKNSDNSLDTINGNETNVRVIITENIQVGISSPYNQSNFLPVLNENSDNYDTFDNQDDMFDTNNSNLSVLDANDNKDDIEDISHIEYTQNNAQEEENLIADSIELPPEANKFHYRFKLIEYYAKIDFLPENEARAAHELQLNMDFKKATIKLKSICWKCDICDQLVYRKQYNLHESAHIEIGQYHCSICFVNLKTENQLIKHNVLRHMFKYICRMCSEVSFTMQEVETHYKNNHSSADLGHRFLVAATSAAETSTPRASVKEKNDPIMKVFTRSLVHSYIEKKKAFEQRQFQQDYIDANFKCGICFKPKKSKSSLELHIRAHNKNERYKHKCSLCTVYFLEQYELLKHNQREHDYKYTCNVCGHEVYDRMAACKHRSEKHAGTRSRYCIVDFKSKTKLRKCMSTHCTVFCNVCGRLFVSRNAVAIHRSIKHAEFYNFYMKATYDPDRTSQFYCSECQVQFFNAVAYNRHLTLKEHLHATIVESTTEDKKKVQTENVMSSRICRAMDCHLCGVFLRTGKIARDHYHKVHTLEEYRKHIHTTTYKCEQCDYTTMNPRYYNWHLRKHKVDFTLPCPICGKRLASVQQLQIHQAVHSDETPYECEHCNKRFKSRRRIQVHIRTVHLKIPYMPWIRRAERRKKERALERQKRAEESQGKYIIKSKHKTLTEKEEPQQDMDVNMMDEEQYTATEYLSNFARSGNVVFATHSRNGYQRS